jgi:uncharacterized protein (DUF2141 family)
MTYRVLASIAVVLLSSSLAPGAAEEAKTGTLTVRATGFTTDAGHVLVQLADSAADYGDDDKASRTAAVKIDGTAATIVFADVPHGDYAVKLFQDANDNQKLDMGLMGPKERYGFSNNVMGTFGPTAVARTRRTIEVEAHRCVRWEEASPWSGISASKQ